jgi:peptidoglycan-N-acetylmuramic acid deacetylase
MKRWIPYTAALALILVLLMAMTALKSETEAKFSTAVQTMAQSNGGIKPTATIEAAPGDGGRAYHFGFAKSGGGKQPSIAREGFRSLLQKREAIFLGDTSKKELFLTFDNGYENGYTARILDVLKDKKVPACFFLTGHYVKDQPELTKRMVQEGHLVGNHSWSHPDMSTLSAEQIKIELDKVKSAVSELTGQTEMAYMRVPRGIFNDRTLAVSKELGYTNVFWSIAYVDWDPKVQRGRTFAFNKVVGQLHPGAVILLHSVSPDNAEAMAAIIDEARRLGYEFKSLDQLTAKMY